MEVQIDYLIWFEQTSLWCLIVIVVEKGNRDEVADLFAAATDQACDFLRGQPRHVAVSFSDLVLDHTTTSRCSLLSY